MNADFPLALGSEQDLGFALSLWLAVAFEVVHEADTDPDAMVGYVVADEVKQVDKMGQIRSIFLVSDRDAREARHEG